MHIEVSVFHCYVCAILHVSMDVCYDSMFATLQGVEISMPPTLTRPGTCFRSIGLAALRYAHSSAVHTLFQFCSVVRIFVSTDSSAVKVSVVSVMFSLFISLCVAAEPEAWP